MPRSLLLLVALLLTATLIAVAAPGAKGPAKADPAAAEAIRKALDSSGNFDFSGVALPGVLNTIAEQYKINIVLDRTVLQQMGFEPEAMIVELKMKEGKLRNALRAIAGQYNLTFAIVGDALVITTEELAVYRQLKQRISVDFDAVPLSKALKELSTKYGVNVVIDPRTARTKSAENPVTLQVDDVPFEAAVRLLCEMANLKPARMGNVIFVTTEARADKLRDSESLVPTPGVPMPAVPGGVLGFAGGIGGGLGGVIVPPPAVATPPVAVPDKADPTPPAKDPPKKDKD
jgi:type II secretory pathway component GspD/PulD (secretin)